MLGGDTTLGFLHSWLLSSHDSVAVDMWAKVSLDPLSHPKFKRTVQIDRLNSPRIRVKRTNHNNYLGTILQQKGNSRGGLFKGE
jgi:hypothetical protein